MQPIVEPRATTGLGHRLAIGALVGVSVLSVAVVALLAIYVDRISEVASGLHRVDALADYPGRPAPVQVADNPAMNFLIFIDSGPQLQAAVIANLSGSRRDLTLIAVPADLRVADAAGTLARAYASDPLRATQLVEKVSGARMDHQVRLELSGFGELVDSLGGVQLSARQLDGPAALSYVEAAGSAPDRSQRAAQLIRGSLITAKADGGVLNVPRFDRLIDALGDCLTVDTGLSNDVIQSILVESRVHLDDVGLWTVEGAPTSAGTQVDPTALDALRSSLAADALAQTPPPELGGLATVGSSVRSQDTGKLGSAQPMPSSPQAAVSAGDEADEPTPSASTSSEPASTSTPDGEEPSPSPSATTTR